MQPVLIGGFTHSFLLTRRFQVALGEENEVSSGMPQKHISKRQDIRILFGITIFLPHHRNHFPFTMYSPLPNIRPGPNYRLVGDEGSELIRDQDLFTNHLG